MNEAIENKLITNILAVTSKISVEFPAMYNLLSETPLQLNYSTKELEAEEYQSYLESIQIQQIEFENCKMAINNNLTTYSLSNERL